MCTVVCRWHREDAVPVQILALRDELYSRDFDLPAAWWPEHPGVIGGRDRRAGGTWCVSDVAAGVTAVVLNRPERMVAAEGAPSRGVLPLLAASHGRDWLEHIDVTPMASFNLVLVGPAALHWWAFDGERLSHQQLRAGTYLFSPRGLADGLDAQLLGGAELTDLRAQPPADVADAWPQWLPAVQASIATEDHAGLLIARPVDGDSYETVFGQLIAAQPGVLRLDYLEHVARTPRAAWTTELWSAA